MKAAPLGHEFKFSSGQTVSSLQQLLHVIKHISETEFHFHLNKEKNDYSFWVLHALREYNLADYLDHCTTKHQVIKEIKKFLHK